MADVTDTFYTTDAHIGYGGQWKIGLGDGSPETFKSVYGVENISFGSTPAGFENKTQLRSPGRAHEKIATIRDLSPFTITGQLNMKHGSHNNAGGDGFTGGGLMAMHRALSEHNMIIEINDGSPNTVMPFRGVIGDFGLGELSLTGIQKFTAVVQPLSDYTGSLP